MRSRARWSRSLAVVAAVAAVLLPGSASAAPATWVASTGPAGIGGAGAVPDVSCPTVDLCLAVTPLGGPVSRAEVLRWAPLAGWQREAPVTTTRGLRPRGISCPTSSFCAVVGSVEPAGTTAGNAVGAIRSADRWRTTPVPRVRPASASNELQDVSCTSAGFCMAVGTGGRRAGMPAGSVTSDAFRWNGSAWVDTAPPTPSVNGVRAGELTSVSCTSSTSCLAVGVRQLPTEGGVFALRWDGRRWSSLAVPASRTDGVISDPVVDCPAAGVCTLGASTDTGAVVLRLASGRWSAQAPAPGQRIIRAVSCPTTARCFSTGSTTSGADVAGAWAAGGAWSAEPLSPARRADSTGLRALDCVVRTGTCTTAGPGADRVRFARRG